MQTLPVWTPHITLVTDNFDVPIPLPPYSPKELTGLTFLHKLPNRQIVRAKICKKLNDWDLIDHQNIKMLISYDEGKIKILIMFMRLGHWDDSEVHRVLGTLNV